MRQGGHVAAPGCEWDMRGGFTKTGPGDSQNRVPRSFFLSVSYGPEPRVGVAAPGDRRWTGATPPFCCPQRARGRCAIHICATPPGGVAPVQIILAGRPGGRTRTGWTCPPRPPPDAKRHIPTKDLSKEGPSFVWTTSPPYGKSKISHRVLRFASSSALPPISPAPSRTRALCSRPWIARTGGRLRRRPEPHP